MIELKKNPYLLAFAAIVVVVLAVLVGLGKVTFERAAELVLAALVAPGLFGWKTKGDPPPPAVGVTLPPSRLPSIRHDSSAPPLLVLLGLAFAVGELTACSSRQAKAEGAYGAELATCLDREKYPTRAASDVCAAEVDRRWPEDAGAVKR